MRVAPTGPTPSDAQSSTEKQIADVEALVARGADVLVLVAQDAAAIRPALSLAKAEGIPVIAYDRLIEAPGVFYLSFDNREVGRLQARVIQSRQPIAALGPGETRRVGELIRRLAGEGLAILLVSHDLHDVHALSDRFTVMKNGRRVGAVRQGEVSQGDLLEMIVAGSAAPGGLPSD